MYVKRLGSGEYEIGFDAPHAAWMELGTPTILPRPFLLPALYAMAGELSHMMKQAWQEAL
jgi:hypothetical protein